MAKEEWKLTVQPNRMGSLIAVAGAWLLCGPLIAWGLLGEPGVGMAVISSLFPIVITYYGLKSAFGLSGRIDIDRNGFSISRGPINHMRFEWNEVRQFVVGQFGASPYYDGKDSPYFEVPDGLGGWRREWLPPNTGYPPEKLIAAMEKLRCLALAGWPRLPTSLNDALN